MIRARRGRWQRRLWSVLPLLASAGLVAGLTGTVLPSDAAAQDNDGNGLLPGVSGLLPVPTSSEPSTSTPPAPTSPAPTSSSPLSPLPTGQNPPPARDKPGLPSLLPPAPAPAPRLSLPTGAPADPRPGPGRAWTLTGSTLKLGGSHYHGYSNQRVGGRTVPTLHFTVDRLEITDLVQRADLGNGSIVRTAGAPRSVSTVINGPIELYTQQLSGTLAIGGQPAVPLKLSPDSLSLPDLDLSFLRLPDLTFKNVVVDNAELNGGQLRIPGARITLE